MLVILGLAIAVGGALEGAEPTLLSPPDWVDKPTPRDLRGAWPREAFLHGMGGRADIDCRVELNGRLDDCEVVRETPSGFGFGAAALSLAPRLRFTPALTDKGPAAWRVTIPINFELTAIPPSEEATEGMAMGDPIDWAAAPTSAELGVAYPRSAAGAPGVALFQCWAAGDGTLNRCMLLRESPEGKGFGRAGYGLLGKFRVRMDPARDPALAAPGRCADPVREPRQSPISWPAGSPIRSGLRDPIPPSPARSIQLRQRRAGVDSGVGIARCQVSADGALSACAPLQGYPDGLGFSEAAAGFAPAMKMSRWTASGSPVDGTVDFRIRLTPKEIAILPPAS